MARTDAATALTGEHQQAQTRLRAQALRDYVRLWPIWHIGDDPSFASLVTATLPLIRVYHRLSATLAGAYYQTFRGAEDAAGQATPRLAPAIAEAHITASLYATGQVATDRALRAGRPPEEARKAALVRTSGAVTRHVLQGGRDTLLESIAADPQSLGWARVTDAAPCAFCALLAGRGPVYKTEHTAEFQAHDHCACLVEPVYPGAAWPGRAREFRKMYDQAVREAGTAGELDRGTSNDLLNAFRRAYEPTSS